MAKYRKKPVVIEAIQLIKTDASIRDVYAFIHKTGKIEEGKMSVIEYDKWQDYLHIVKKQGGIEIKTLESHTAKLLASFGDFIIKGVVGEFYPCKPDVFEKTYEAVQDSQ